MKETVLYLRSGAWYREVKLNISDEEFNAIVGSDEFSPEFDRIQEEFGCLDGEGTERNDGSWENGWDAVESGPDEIEALWAGLISLLTLTTKKYNMTIQFSKV